MPFLFGNTGICCRGSGLAAALSSTEWQTRRAAAEALQAVAMAFGPAMDTDPPKNLAKSDEMAKPSSLRATSALGGNCRHDKIRPVRAAATEAAAVFQSLQVCLIPTQHKTCLGLHAMGGCSLPAPAGLCSCRRACVRVNVWHMQFVLGCMPQLTVLNLSCSWCSAHQQPLQELVLRQGLHFAGGRHRGSFCLPEPAGLCLNLLRTCNMS